MNISEIMFTTPALVLDYGDSIKSYNDRFVLEIDPFCDLVIYELMQDGVSDFLSNPVAKVYFKSHCHLETLHLIVNYC